VVSELFGLWVWHEILSRTGPAILVRLILQLSPSRSTYPWIGSERALPHIHNGTTFFKSHLVHECLHEINATTATEVDIPWRCLGLARC
jgi:hypothetical protein